MGRIALLGFAATAALALGIVLSSRDGRGQPAAPRTSASAARAFLGRYEQPDGRVVRRDQGGDTVSEGQAYAMLAAVVAGDRKRFDRAWGWARAHLRRPDGLLSWHWQDGRVADPQPAADADLDTAHALVLGARRFREPALRRAGLAMGAAIRAQETRRGVLVAGPWARERAVLNASYFDPHALRAVGLGDVASATRAAVAPLLAAHAAPPDWAVLSPAVRPSGPPGKAQPPGYGFDAARLPVRLAASCDPADRAAVAALPPLSAAAPAPHPVFTVAAAAQAAAAGDARRAGALLDRAAAQDRRAPTYFGAAWVALGRALLQTDSLGSCSGRR